MKQIERRYPDEISIECTPTLMEKIRMLFSNTFVVYVNLNVNSSDGIVCSERGLLTLKTR